VVFNSENKVLLLEHSFRSGSGWVLPGGFIEANEQPEEAIKREIFEEAGLERRGARGAVIPLNLLRGYTDPSLL
jgi:ADP-ribose pyrophosphatase YjhB (NUDIX family)